MLMRGCIPRRVPRPVKNKPKVSVSNSQQQNNHAQPKQKVWHPISTNLGDIRRATFSLPRTIYQFPEKGAIKRICLYVDAIDPVGAQPKINLYRNGVLLLSVPFSQGENPVDQTQEVSRFDLFQITISGECECTNVNVSFLYSMDVE